MPGGGSLAFDFSLVGDAGDQGLAGLPGDDGRPGPVGNDGFPGAFGEPGTDGRQGAVGEVGEFGAPGPKGDLGDTGSPGDAGGEGERGQPGPPGPQGLFHLMTGWIFLRKQSNALTSCGCTVIAFFCVSTDKACNRQRPKALTFASSSPVGFDEKVHCLLATNYDEAF